MIKKYLTVKNIIITALIIAALIIVLIYLVQCRKTQSAKPVYVPIKEQVKVVEKDTLYYKKQKDSFINIINSLVKENDDNNKEFVWLYNENSQLQADMLALSKVTPDTCAKFVAQYKGYAEQTNKTLSTANITIAGLNKTISTQKDFLTAKDVAFDKMKTAWDTCISTAKKLEQYAKEIKPKRELNIGAKGMINYASNYLPAAGLEIGYRTRKGLEINAAIYTNQILTIGFKKPIFRF